VQHFSPADRRAAEQISRLAYCNPFLPERIDTERAILGSAFVAGPAVWSKRPDADESPNLLEIGARAEALARRWREHLRAAGKADERELALYEDVVLYALYHRWRNEVYEAIEQALERKTAGKVRIWPAFLEEYRGYLQLPDVRATRTPGLRPDARPASDGEASHVFACFFQLRRAFHHIFEYIIGSSLPAARLRAAVWQSIFTHDMRRYRQSFYDRLGDFSTLVQGPSGTGKELVARAIGLSRYVPFDPEKGAFVGDLAGSFQALNLSAMAPTLIESELFGHRRGAFTGAVADRQGWLEVCEPLGTVFLDEIGELEAAVQVKLLRVVQGRTFQRLGDTADRHFRGKIIAATNRDLAAEMRAGRFRQDFYYRLCSDIIRTPSLREQIADAPDELHDLIRFLVRRIGGEELEGLDDEVHRWIERHLPADYPWPGNIRELEQCVRNVLIRGAYQPAQTPAAAPADPFEALAAALRRGDLTADQVVGQYCTLVYAMTGSYLATAERLKLDRRTVRSKIDGELLKRIQ
jgi:transcriptional regulator with AAA-type ATPase domain